MSGFKSFTLIWLVFDRCNGSRKYSSDYEEIKVWYYIQKDGAAVRQWLNDMECKNGERKMLQIQSYADLEKKIKNKLKQMGYGDVNKIPEDITITYE